MTPADLEVGKVYFSCGYLLRFRPVPMFEVLVYAGKNLVGNDLGEDLYYFKEPEAYFHEELVFEAAELQRENYEASTSDEWHVFSSDELSALITDLQGLER